MADNDVVLEAKVSASGLTFHLPMEDGDRVSEAIEEALKDSEVIRHVDFFELEEVYPVEEY